MCRSANGRMALCHSGGTHAWHTAHLGAVPATQSGKPSQHKQEACAQQRAARERMDFTWTPSSCVCHAACTASSSGRGGSQSAGMPAPVDDVRILHSHT